MCHKVDKITGFRILVAILSVVLTSVIVTKINNVASNYFVLNNATASTGPGVDKRRIPQHSNEFDDVSSSQKFNQSSILLILTDNNEQFFQHNVDLSTVLKTCPSASGCEFTTDKSRLDSVQSVVVLSRNVTFLRLVATLNKKGKFWILLLPDPRFHKSFLESLVDIKTFDALISYLPNSNLALGESMFVELKQDNSVWQESTQGLNQSRPRNYRHKYKHCSRPSRKLRLKRQAPSDSKRLVATILDECTTQSNREGYIREMKKSGLTVQVFGKCGIPCPGATKTDCFKYIDNHFQFYLMFETFICQHYLSMELWELLSETSHLVPVVFGGVNYVDLLPQDAYIDALNHSPASLAGTIFFLSRNKQTFKSYFAWRKHCKIRLEKWPCGLCRIMPELTQPVSKKAANRVQMTPERLCTSWPMLKFT